MRYPLDFQRALLRNINNAIALDDTNPSKVALEHVLNALNDAPYSYGVPNAVRYKEFVSSISDKSRHSDDYSTFEIVYDDGRIVNVDVIFNDFSEKVGIDIYDGIQSDLDFTPRVENGTIVL